MATSAADFAAALVDDLASSLQPCETVYGWDVGTPCGKPAGRALKSCANGHERAGYVCRACVTGAGLLYCLACRDGGLLAPLTFRTEVG